MLDMDYSRVVDLYPDPQGSVTFAGSGSITPEFLIRIRVLIRKWMLTTTKTIKKRPLEYTGTEYRYSLPIMF
jgi:hypothetical protein